MTNLIDAGSGQTKEARGLFIGSDLYWVALGLLAFFFIVPLPSNEWIFQLGKLCLMGGLLIFTATFIFLNREKYIYRFPKPFYLALLAYLFWIVLTNTAFSSQPQYTLIGWQNWNGGLLTNFLYWTMLLLSGFAPKSQDQSQEKKVVLALSLALAFIATFTVMEFVGLRPLLGGRLSDHFGLVLTNTTYPILTVGNSGWIAGIYTLLAPLIVYYALRKKDALMYLALFFSLLGVTATQSNIVALLLSIMLIGLAIFLAVGNKYKRYFVALTLLVAALTPPVITDGLIALSKNVQPIIGIDESDRKNELDYAQTSGSTAERLIIFKSAFRSALQRPLTGWGYETFHFNFYEHLAPEEETQILKKIIRAQDGETVERHDLTVTATRETSKGAEKRSSIFLMVKPHNYLLEEFYSNGIPAVLILVYLAYLIVSHFLRNRSLYSYFIFTSVVLYLAYLMGWFFNPSVTFLAMALLGVLMRTQAKPPTSKL